MNATKLVAQEDGPITIPERLQELAKKYPISDRLKINWSEATTEDIGRYTGFLAAANVTALEIADRNKRSDPNDDDYISSLIALCIWPPNKPPFVEKFWPTQEAAFYDEPTRDLIRKAVGPAAADIPFFLTKYTDPQQLSDTLPTDEQQYFKDIFDARLFNEAK